MFDKIIVQFVFVCLIITCGCASAPKKPLVKQYCLVDNSVTIHNQTKFVLKVENWPEEIYPGKSATKQKCPIDTNGIAILHVTVINYGAEGDVGFKYKMCEIYRKISFDKSMKSDITFTKWNLR